MPGSSIWLSRKELQRELWRPSDPEVGICSRTSVPRMQRSRGYEMKHWNRNVFLGSHDLQERLRAEIVRRWPEAQYPFHIQVLAEETATTVEVRVWSDEGIHILEEAIPESFPPSKDDPTIAAVLRTVDLALREAAAEKLAIDRAVR